MIDRPSREILYLNESHLDSLDLEISRVIDVLDEAFRYKAAGATLMPPKTFFHLPGDRFYSAKASCFPPLGYAASKWQSGDPSKRSPGRWARPAD